MTAAHHPDDGWQLQLSEAAGLDIIAAIPRDAEGDALARELQRTQARIRRLWPLPSRLPADADVLVCELLPGLPQSLPWLPGEPAAALVVVMGGHHLPNLKLLRNCAPHAVLHRPFTAAMVLTSLTVARLQYLYERRLRNRIDKLDETLRAVRSVERAKSILMQTRQFDEPEAYHFMRRQAMKRRVSISAVAAAIVDSHEVLG
jgi:two-component system, response regulator / RNA-binding antiterminator